MSVIASQECTPTFHIDGLDKTRAVNDAVTDTAAYDAEKLGQMRSDLKDLREFLPWMKLVSHIGLLTFIADSALLKNHIDVFGIENQRALQAFAGSVAIGIYLNNIYRKHEAKTLEKKIDGMHEPTSISNLISRVVSRIKPAT